MSAVELERRGRLNRPEAMHAVSTGLIEGLDVAVQAARDPDVGAMMIWAQGPTFCAGADLVEANTLTERAQDFRGWITRWRTTFASFELLEKPVVAAVQGLAVAGGIEMVLACDVIVASTAARFGDLHIRTGLVPGGGGSQRLPEAIGTRRARWLMYSGEILDAAEAERLGLVQKLLPEDGFHEAAWGVVDRIANNSPAALAFMKRLSRPGSISDDALEYGVESAVNVVMGPDAQEGIDAFVNKRKPAFPSLAS
jgi:enoyl-CoA hydratase